MAGVKEEGLIAISEYVREAIRHYMNYQQFTRAQKVLAKKAKRRGIKKSDVAAVIEELRSHESN